MKQDHYYMIPFIQKSRIEKSIEIESRLVVASGWGRGMWQMEMTAKE